MQKAILILVLALTLSCAVAEYNVTTAAWAKPPVTICADNETNCTSVQSMGFVSLTSEVNLLAFNKPSAIDPTNTSSVSWTIFTKNVDSKTLEGSSSKTYTFKAIKKALFSGGYFFGFATSKDTSNIDQIYVYQTKLDGAVELPRVQLTANTNATFTPTIITYSFDTKTLVSFYIGAYRKVNFNSMTFGGNSVGKEYTLSSNYTSEGEFNVGRGAALSTSQIFAAWPEGTDYKAAIVDYSSGALTANATLAGYSSLMTCRAYATYQKNYGVWCSSNVNGTKTVYVTANGNATLKQLFSFNTNGIDIIDSFVNDGYLGFFYQAQATSSNTRVLSYETWDVEALKVVKSKTDYLSYNVSSSSSNQYQSPAGNIYVLMWNNPMQNVTTLTSVQGGLLIQSSVAPAPQPNTTNTTNSTNSSNSSNSTSKSSFHLMTIFGFMVSLIAGLLLL